MLPRACSISAAALLAFAAIARLAASPDFNRDIRPILPTSVLRATDRMNMNARAACASTPRTAPPPEESQKNPQWSPVSGTQVNYGAGSLPQTSGNACRRSKPDTPSNQNKSNSSDNGSTPARGTQRHWSFIPPQKAALPDATGPAHAIDQFVSTRLAASHLTLRQGADLRTLLRRLSLDLTGLPPTLDEVAAFSRAFATDPAAFDRTRDRPSACLAAGCSCAGGLVGGVARAGTGTCRDTAAGDMKPVTVRPRQGTFHRPVDTTRPIATRSRDPMSQTSGCGLWFSVDIKRFARCNDGRGTFNTMFFSDEPHDVARAKAICARCMVREPCLGAAIAREEPWGVWGGEIFVDGHVVAVKRRRGRPPVHPRPPLVVAEVPGEFPDVA